MRWRREAAGNNILGLIIIETHAMGVVPRTSG